MSRFRSDMSELVFLKDFTERERELEAGQKSFPAVSVPPSGRGPF